VGAGAAGHLITAVLRPGTTHASHGIVLILKRMVDRMRQAWPEVGMEVRADAGFATLAVDAWCEAETITERWD
jgi:hypothetical protein